jgi:glycosyltransferase involved in cell wall biosynthesis
MEKKYNILFLASWYPNKTSPQAGNFIQLHARSVSAHCNIHTLCIVPRIQKEKFVLESEKKNNVNETIVYYKKITSKTPILHQLLKLNIRKKAYQLGFHKIISKTKNIDLIHLNVCFPAGLYALYLKKKLKIPFILTEHWTAFLKNDTTQLSGIEKYYIKKIANQAEIICPVSEDLKINMEKFGIKNTFKVIPNIVNTKLFKPQLYINSIEHKFKILHISNLKDEHKNITDILKTIKKLHQTRNDFFLTIAGNGDIEKYKKLAFKLNIPDKLINFEGDKTSNEVAKLMSSHDFFLLFSNYETFSVVIAEAWACGLPVVSSKCGGLTEEITSKNGIQVEIKNKEALLKAIIYMMDNIESFDNEKIAKYAENNFNEERISNQIINIYNSILKV